MTEIENSPWTHVDQEEPPRDGSLFYAWDDQLNKLLITMRWYAGEINDFGTEEEAWSGSFSYWMPKEDDSFPSASPYDY